jgi:hypothetical protein
VAEAGLVPLSADDVEARIAKFLGLAEPPPPLSQPPDRGAPRPHLGPAPPSPLAVAAIAARAGDPPLRPSTSRLAAAMRRLPPSDAELDAAARADADLVLAALVTVYARGGFTAVMAAVQTARKQLACDNRAAVDREGWIV